jgi:hypothetical protein
MLLLPLAGCNSLKSIQVVPGPGVQVLNAVGQTAQYTAIATDQQGSATPTTSNITDSVTWSVSNPSVATISATGLATAVGIGYTLINAESGGVIANSDLTVAGSSSSTPSLAVTPATATASATGQTTQFVANGSLTGLGSTQNLTNSVVWGSSNVAVATITQGGLATAVGAGMTTITAQAGGLTANATLTVSLNSGQSTLTVIPGTANATFTGETTQFIALGNLSGNGTTQNLTNNVLWLSSDTSVATIDQNGLATVFGAYSPNTVSTTITAIGSSPTGSLITASSILQVLSVVGSSGTITLPTLAVYEVGTGSGTVTSSPSPINCSASSSTCSGSFQLNSAVTMTATPASGSSFGGWSSNCTPTNSLVCTVTMSNNETVGAIFNKP